MIKTDRCIYSFQLLIQFSVLISKVTISCSVMSMNFVFLPKYLPYYEPVLWVRVIDI